MSIIVKWLNSPRNILYQRFSGDWTIDEYYQALDVTFAHIGEVDHAVDVIINFSGNTSSFSRLVSATTSTFKDVHNARVHPNQRMMVVVGGGAYMRTIIEMGERLAPDATRNLYCADSLDEAHVIIQQHRLRAN